MKHSINGAEIAFDDEGAGPALLFIHAGIADRRMWHRQASELARTNRMIRLDLRGFGDSSLPPTDYAHYEDARGLLDALGVERAVAVGDSMGGEVALDLALAHPERIAGLVLVSTHAGVTTASDELQRVWRESDEAFERGDIDAAVAIEATAWVFGAGRSASEVDPEYRALAEAMIRTTWERAAAGEVPGRERTLQPPRTERLHEVRSPVLLVRGDRDLPEIAESMAVLAAGIPGARTAVIPDTAHLPPLERPAEFNRLVREFLAEIDWSNHPA